MYEDEIAYTIKNFEKAALDSLDYFKSDVLNDNNAYFQSFNINFVYNFDNNIYFDVKDEVNILSSKVENEIYEFIEIWVKAAMQMVEENDHEQIERMFNNLVNNCGNIYQNIINSIKNATYDISDALRRNNVFNEQYERKIEEYADDCCQSISMAVQKYFVQQFGEDTLEYIRKLEENPKEKIDRKKSSYDYLCNKLKMNIPYEPDKERKILEMAEIGDDKGLLDFIASDRFSMVYLPEEYLSDKNFMKKVIIHNNPLGFAFLPEDLYNDKKFVEELLSVPNSLISFIMTEDKLQDPEMFEAAYEQFKKICEQDKRLAEQASDLRLAERFKKEMALKEKSTPHNSPQSESSQETQVTEKTQEEVSPKSKPIAEKSSETVEPKPVVEKAQETQINNEYQSGYDALEKNKEEIMELLKTASGDEKEELLRDLTKIEAYQNQIKDKVDTSKGKVPISQVETKQRETSTQKEENSVPLKLIEENEDLEEYEEERNKILNSKHFSEEQKLRMLKELEEEFGISEEKHSKSR